jgi:hypothetical protein
MEEIQGSAESQQAGSDVEKNQSKDKVAYETYQKVLAEAKNAKEKLRLLESEKQAETENKLKENNEWKTLAEVKAKEASEFRAKYEEINVSIVDAMKVNAFQKHLGGKIKDEAYFQFIEKEKIAYNPETGRVDEESAKSAVAEFVKKHPSLVEFRQGRMPNEAAKEVRQKSYEEMNPKEREELKIKLMLEKINPK